jgi:TRAP-type C4-dicarboxylate transport system substrate-binding protein
MNMAFKTMGFHVVETELVDIGPKLAGNMINALYMIPAAVAPMGLHKELKHMMNTPLAPIMGTIVMNRVTWNKLGPARQREMMRVAQQVADEFNAIMPRATDNAIAMMSRNGLKVNNLSRAQEDLWFAELHKTIPSLVGTTFDRNLYQQINRILERARSSRNAGQIQVAKPVN